MKLERYRFGLCRYSKYAANSRDSKVLLWRLVIARTSNFPFANSARHFLASESTLLDLAIKVEGAIAAMLTIAAVSLSIGLRLTIKVNRPSSETNRRGAAGSNALLGPG